MTATDYATHWATVLGCDMRAQMPEIQRAAYRRVRELLEGPLWGEDLSKAILRIGEALDQAKREKSETGRKGSSAGRVEE